jgi:hypothetical protein
VVRAIARRRVALVLGVLGRSSTTQRGCVPRPASPDRNSIPALGPVRSIFEDQPAASGAVHRKAAGPLLPDAGQGGRVPPDGVWGRSSSYWTYLDDSDNAARCGARRRGPSMIGRTGPRACVELRSWLAAQTGNSRPALVQRVGVRSSVDSPDAAVCHENVSEGGLEPPPPIRGLAPQASASAYSATRTGCAAALPAAATRNTLANIHIPAIIQVKRLLGGGGPAGEDEGTLLQRANEEAA